MSPYEETPYEVFGFFVGFFLVHGGITLLFYFQVNSHLAALSNLNL